MQQLTARLVPFKRRGGRENMAIDEHLLALHGPSGAPVLRLYGWDPPAITIGRYQAMDRIDSDACRRDGVEVVRRITGGGAIYHDNEITYSVIWPDSGIERPGGIDRTFEAINAFILEAYRFLGLDPAYAKDYQRHGNSPGRTQFCFSGNELYDILIEGKKIGGNAQRRVRGAVLQHGSIPLAIDAVNVQRYFRDRIDAGNFIGLNDACGRDVSAGEVAGVLVASFKRAMEMGLSEEDLKESEDESVRALLDDRYSRDEWNYSITREDQ
jgi:lipoate-protein ligase A